MPNKRTIDLLVESFDLSVRRKYEIKNANGDVVTTLYFPPITRADRKKAQARANTTDGLEISTQMLCQIAEKEIVRYTQRIPVNLDPLESPRSQLSNASGFVKIRSVYRQIRTLKTACV